MCPEKLTNLMKVGGTAHKRQEESGQDVSQKSKKFYSLPGWKEKI